MDEEVVRYPEARYNGDYITCYPGSNQVDDGKLNLEYNMARIVTRVTSKNFCIVEPSFELSIINSNETGAPQIQVGPGQCCINGMDLIMTENLVIDAPGEDQPGTYYLAFRLARDSSDNVLSDFIYGDTTTFQGVYLTYWTEKSDPIHPDMLYLGKLDWDGEQFSNLEEDEDKYGRIWAEDILCKINDPKHPDITRLKLQQWIYNVPDWYVSKEGDVEYGAIEFLPGREGVQQPGIKIQSISDNEAQIIMKAPSLADTEEDNILKAYAKNNNIEIDIGQSKIISGTSNMKRLALETPNAVEFTSDSMFSVWGKTGIYIRAGEDGYSPYLSMGNNSAIFRGSTGDLEDGIYFNENSLSHTIGKSTFEYTSANKNLTLQATNTNLFNVNPDMDITNSARVRDTLYIGYNTENTDFDQQKTYLSAHIWRLASDYALTQYMTFRPTSIDFFSNGRSTTLSKSSSTQTLIASNNFEVEENLIVNGTTTLTGNTYIGDSQQLQVDTDGNLETTGEIRASKVWNAVYNDLAEYMEKENPEEVIESGDVVCFTDNGKVTKVKNVEDTLRVAGVVSSLDTAGQILGGDGLKDNEKVLVALAGRVYVKVDCPVYTGNLLRIMHDGTVSVTNTLDRFVIGKATKPSENGIVYMKVI